MTSGTSLSLATLLITGIAIQTMVQTALVHQALLYNDAHRGSPHSDFCTDQPITYAPATSAQPRTGVRAS
jgi:hypothetical protein